MDFNEFLSHFEGVRKSGGGYLAKCPAHNDHTPSLSVTRNGDKVLVHCHAGCDVEAVLGAVGLTKRDLFLGEGKPVVKKEVVYRYVDERNEVLYEKVRYMREDGKKSFWVNPPLSSVSRRVLYRLNEVIRARERGEVIYFVEGEKDVETLREMGLTATTVDCGSNVKWLLEHLEVLEPLYGARVVILCDNDEVGEIYAKVVCIGLLGKASEVKFIEFKNVEENFVKKGDVTDWVERYGGTLERLLEIVEKASVVQLGNGVLEGLHQHIGTCINDVDKGVDKGVDRGEDKFFEGGSCHGKRGEGGVSGGEYEVVGGAFYHIRGEKREKIANFHAWVEVEYEVYGDGGLRVVYEVCGETEYGERLGAVKVFASEFYSKVREWVSVWGSRVLIRPRCLEHLCNAIIGFSLPRREVIFTNTGFVEHGGKRYYCVHGGVIGGDEGMKVEVEGEGRRYQIEKPSEEALYRGRQTALALLSVADPEIVFPLWGAMFLAPLCEWVSPNFVLWLYGRTGSYKSTLASLFMNFFGNFTAGTLLSWNATANALEKYLYVLKDVPVVIDDFAPMSDVYMAQKAEQVVGKIVRDVGNGVGRARMRYDLSLSEVWRPRGFVISTAELLPHNESILARLMVVNVARERVNVSLMSDIEGQRGYLKACMYDYIEYVMAREKEIRGQIEEWVKLYRNEVFKHGCHGRLVEAVSKMMVGVEVALGYFMENAVISKDTVAHFRKTAFEVLVKNMLIHQEEQMKENPLVVFFEVLSDAIACEKALLRKRDGSGVIGDGEMVGWIDDKAVHLHLREAYRLVSRVLRESSQRIPLKERELRKMVVESDFAIKDIGGAHRDVIRVGERTYRVLSVSLSKLKELGLWFNGQESVTQATSGVTSAVTSEPTPF